MGSYCNFISKAEEVIQAVQLLTVLLGVSSFAVFRSMHDFYLIKHGEYVNHSWNAAITVLICVMAASSIPTFFMGLAVYWLVFDYSLNRKRNLDWWYVGQSEESAFTDRMISKFPKIAVGIKVILIILCGVVHLIT